VSFKVVQILQAQKWTSLLYFPVYVRLFPDRGFTDNTHDPPVDFHNLGCIQEF